MKYSGIDLHSNNSLVTVTDEEDRVVAEKRLLVRYVPAARLHRLNFRDRPGAVLRASRGNVSIRGHLRRWRSRGYTDPHLQGRVPCTVMLDRSAGVDSLVG